MWDLSKFASNIALQDEGGKCITYNALDSACKDFFSHINKRCLIFILCRNQTGSVIGYVASLNNKVVPVLLNADLDSDLLKSLIQVYKPAYLWVPIDKTDLFAGYETAYSEWDYSLIRTTYDTEHFQ